MIESDEEMIFVTWALGPSYRYRLKQFIKYNKTTTTCDKVRYLIFTDDVAYFDYLKDMNDVSVIEIMNIHDFIESRNIELATGEYVPRASDSEWASESRKHWGEFSYPLKRVIFLRLYELGITKFALIDPDVYVNPDITKEQLYKGLDIPPNSVSVMGRAPVEGNWNESIRGIHLTSPRSMGIGTFLDFYRMAYFLMYRIRENVQKKYDHNIELKHHSYYSSYDLSEGIFHYYHFADTEKLLEYYRVCDETVRLLYLPEYKSVTVGPGWLIPDFTVLALTNQLCDIKSYDADQPVELFYGMLFYEDKYVMPNWGGIEPADTLESFAQINKEILNREYFNRAPRFGWWNFLRDFNAIDLDKYNNFIQENPQFKEAAPEYYDPSWLTSKD